MAGSRQIAVLADISQVISGFRIMSAPERTCFLLLYRVAHSRNWDVFFIRLSVFKILENCELSVNGFPLEFTKEIEN